MARSRKNEDNTNTTSASLTRDGETNASLTQPQRLDLPGEAAGLVPTVIPQGGAELGEPSETEPMTEEEATAAREAAAQRYYQLFYAGHGTPPSNIPSAEDTEGQLVDMEGRGLDILAEDATIEETELNEVPAADESRVEREGETLNGEEGTNT